MIGIDYLGLAHPLWPIEDTLKVTPRGTAIGVLDNTFGDVRQHLRVLLESEKFCVVRIHFWWADNHSIASIEHTIKMAKKWQKFIGQFPHVKFYLSPSLEHYEKSKPEVQARIEAVKQFAPSATPVNCPSGVGTLLLNCTNERHSHGENVAMTRPFLVSTDGESIFDMDASRYVEEHKQARITFFWDWQLNLKRKGETPPSPKERTKPPTKECLLKLRQLVLKYRG